MFLMPLVFDDDGDQYELPEASRKHGEDACPRSAYTLAWREIDISFVFVWVRALR